MRKLVNVYPSGSNICCYQHPYLACFEVSKGFGTCSLTFVSVNGSSFDAALFKLFCQPVGTVFGTGKDQHLLPFFRFDQLRKQLTFAALVHMVYHLTDLLGCGVFACHFDGFGVMQQSGCKLFDLRREGSRKEQRLTLLGHHFHQFFDIVDKPHVKHSVRLI